jgi:DNA-binding GntR family transcriptional regulator
MDDTLWPYQRVLADLRRRIESGELTGKLLTRMKLAEEYGVSPMTIQRAINALKAEGLVHSVPALGVFVRQHGDLERE